MLCTRLTGRLHALDVLAVQHSLVKLSTASLARPRPQGKVLEQ